MHTQGLVDAFDTLQPHYDHLVVGSGYGASVAALRLAERAKPGERIALLERGKAWNPGDFPHELGGLLSEIRSTVRPLGLLENRTALSADVDVISANGLGGTSLINAAISVRPIDALWNEREWPEAIRRDAQADRLATYYARAEEMLEPLPHPDAELHPRSVLHREHFAPKFRSGALPLNIRHVAGMNRFGLEQPACHGCGNCCGGCNTGAKNTLLTNYLAAARRLGVSIFTGMHVTHVEKLPLSQGARWLLHYVHYGEGSLGHDGVVGTLTATHVFLGAGSAGTTEILMRSERAGLDLSETLGSRVSANGDVLGAIYNAPIPLGATPFAEPLQVQPNRVGPTISSYVDFRTAERPLDAHFLLLDGVIPRPFVRAAARALAVHPNATMAAIGSPSALARLARDAVGLSYPGPDGALSHTMILLACGHDSAGGRYVFEDERVYVRWPSVMDEPSIRTIHEEMRAYAARLGGVFLENPRSAMTRTLQATHPLGGAPMGDDVQRGTVDHRGAVFALSGGVHEGLFVVDAAMIPRSLAAPPLLTITALAERAMDAFFANQTAL